MALAQSVTAKSSHRCAAAYPPTCATIHHPLEIPAQTSTTHRAAARDKPSTSTATANPQQTGTSLHRDSPSNSPSGRSHAPYAHDLPEGRLDNARQTRRPRHACGRLRHIHLLHHLDAPHPLCRRRPPAPEPLPRPRLGHSHPRHPHPPRLRRRRLLPRHRHDPKQQEEGRQGQGCREEEGLRELPSSVERRASSVERRASSVERRASSVERYKVARANEERGALPRVAQCTLEVRRLLEVAVPVNQARVVHGHATRIQNTGEDIQKMGIYTVVFGG